MDLGDLGFGTANTPGRRQKGIIDLDRVLIRDNARIDRSIFFGCGEDGPGFKLRNEITRQMPLRMVYTIAKRRRPI